MMTAYARVDNGIVVELFETDGDITEMFHPDLIWVALIDGSQVVPGWWYDGNEFTAPPPPTEEELAVAAMARRAGEMTYATEQIAPLQDAVDLGEATATEESLLVAWKQYRVALNRLPQSSGWPTNIQWPVPPT